MTTKATSESLGSCPYRGAHNDPELRFGFPADNTYCYKATPPASVNKSHQSTHCLTDEYVNCPVFQQRQAISLPKELATLQKRTLQADAGSEGGRPPFLWLIPLVALVLAGGGAIWSQLNRTATPEPTTPAIGLVDTATPTTQPSATALATDVPIATNTPLSTATSLPTNTATPTAQPTDTPPATATVAPMQTATPTPTPTPLPTATPTPITADVVVRLDSVIVRRGPDASFNMVASTGEAGAMLTAIGRSENSLWLEVCCIDGQSGWIASGFVNLPDILQMPVSDTPKTVAVVSEPTLDFLAYPNYSADSLTTVLQGEAFDLVGRYGSEWVKLCCSGGVTGWVYVGTLLVDGAIGSLPLVEDAIPTPTPTPNPITTSGASSIDVVVRLDSVIVRRGPDPTFHMVASTGEAGAMLTAIGRSADSLWIEVCCFDEVSGWIPSGFVNIPNILQLPIGTTPQTVAIVSEPTLDLLDTPSYSAASVATVAQGNQFEVVGRFGNEWVRLCCVEDASGWVFVGTLFIDGELDTIPEE